MGWNCRRLAFKLCKGGTAMGFRYDTRHLPSQTQQIIRKRDESNILFRESTDRTEQYSQPIVYETAIFMKLGFDITGKFNGMQTLEKYQNFCNESKQVWFSTDSLSAGMAEKKRQEFLSAIKKDYVLEIYFAVSKNSDGYNDIVYKGEVLDIKVDGDGMLSPDKKSTPNEWKDVKNKIWIKLRNIKRFSSLGSKDFIVVSTGNTLSEVISKSQYHFGYIKKK